MDAIGLEGLLALFGIPSILLLASMRWRKKRIDTMKQWPAAQATVESVEYKVLSGGKFQTYTLPVFAFSYQVRAEYFSGYFALIPYITDPGSGLVARMIGRKLQVRYDPARPDVWFIPDELIEGCKIEQKQDPRFGYNGVER